MNYGSRHNKRIRFLFYWNLVLSLLLLACIGSKKENIDIAIQWNGEKAEGVIIPITLVPDVMHDSIGALLQVRLNSSATPIMHEELTVGSESITFKPLIPFTRGLKYDVVLSNKLIGQFEIPPVNTNDRTEVVSVYPTTDTLPENTLKLYVNFSKPMREGQALNNIAVIKNENDTLRSTFLDLDKELWNSERTVLTLWFDPGRIKRDLQPNKTLGAPLQENNHYKIIISENWMDERGLALRSNYQKNFLVGKRDNTSPDPSNWTINQPKASTRDVLSIDLLESLDYLLLKNAIQVNNSDGNTINGSFEPAEKETILNFTPDKAWTPGEYLIRIETRLEDLAGNNLNRLFDRDITQPTTNNQATIFTKKFRVE